MSDDPKNPDTAFERHVAGLVEAYDPVPESVVGEARNAFEEHSSSEPSPEPDSAEVAG